MTQEISSAQTDSPSFEVDIDQIVVKDRVRKDFGDLQDLAESIKTEGLIQPIVVTQDYRLIAGERRLRAHKLLGLKTIKVCFFEVLDEAHLVRLEATENIQRHDFTWQEKVLAIDKVHQLMSTQSALKSESWGVRETGRLLNLARANVGRATFIAEFLRQNDKEICEAENMTDAFKILLDRREQEANKLLVSTTLPRKTKEETKASLDKLSSPSASFFQSGTATFIPGVSDLEEVDETPGQEKVEIPQTIPLSEMCFLGDCLDLLRPNMCNHISTDIPYGIDMDMLSQSSTSLIDTNSVKKEHDVEENIILWTKMMPLFFSAIDDKGFLVMWCDMTHWQRLCELCTSAGFSVQRWPLVWHKTSTCKNQAAQYNFTKNVEVAVVARKGNATLVSSQGSCVYSGSNDVESKSLGHPFVKPFGLWNWIYSAITLRGDTVLDPFAGVGSSTIPAIQRGLRPITFECNETHYNRQIINLQNVYKSLNPNVKFS
jgi:DNA modification methylase